MYIPWAQGRSQEFTKGETNQEVWGTEVPSGVQGQNMETLENTNGAVTKIDLRCYFVLPTDREHVCLP